MTRVGLCCSLQMGGAAVGRQREAAVRDYHADQAGLRDGRGGGPTKPDDPPLAMLAKSLNQSQGGDAAEAEAEPASNDEREAAALKIQAVQRGKAARNEVEILKADAAAGVANGKVLQQNCAAAADAAGTVLFSRSDDSHGSGH